MKQPIRTKEQMENWMIYLKMTNGITVPLFRRRKTYFSCHRMQKKLENEFDGWNGHLIVKH